MTIFRLCCHPNKNHLPNFFFLRLVGRPGKYLYVVGSYRMEEVMHKEIKKKKKKATETYYYLYYYQLPRDIWLHFRQIEFRVESSHRIRCKHRMKIEVMSHNVSNLSSD